MLLNAAKLGINNYLFTTYLQGSYSFFRIMKAEHTPITTQEQYNAVAARIEQLKDARAGSEEAKELKKLTKMIVDFERRNPQPIEPTSKKG